MSISQSVRDRIRQKADNRCGYCQAHQNHLLAKLEIEHIVPLAKGGTDIESNLWLACRSCNSYKGDKIEGRDPDTGQVVSLFNPSLQKWNDHFSWREEGVYLVGISPIGRATIAVLQINHDRALTVRQNWVLVGWHPPGMVD